ncbi:MAG: DUF2330 domain-containing protein [Myxococcota bacterium]|nr:DUF2330 domain-containing protein [Myxococcota bacterium]
MRYVIGLMICLMPAVSWACGGLFCNNAQPINQAAERILFALDGDQLHMHVRITYSGPPSEFGWLLPVPEDVETTVSSEELFVALDRRFAPRFNLRTEFDDNCPQPDFADEGFSGAVSASAESADSAVEVLSREQVGPYDRTVIKSASIEALRGWLNENNYQIPDAVDEKLLPYIDLGSAFVAIKLVPGRMSSDIVPLKLSFRGDQPTIPIIPTSVAANPDMGILVHLLGSSRAIPANYLHVVINEGAIDWLSGGQNYADVVSQAADEAMGQAFATDFAGLHEGRVTLPLVDEMMLTRIEAIDEFDDAAAQLLETLLFSNLNGFDAFDADIQREMTSSLMLPADFDQTPEQVLQCLRCPDNLMAVQVDGAALAMKLRALNEIRADLNALLIKNPYLTRLYSTMSPDEMTLDPVFAFNRDLEDVANVRTAVRRVRCSNGDIDMDDSVIETASGQMIQLEAGTIPSVIMRQDGQTMRGVGVPAAALIERQQVAGQSEVIDDRTDLLMQAEVPMRTGDDGTSGAGCACDTGGGDGGHFLWLFIFMVPPLRRHCTLKAGDRRKSMQAR